MPYVGRLGFNYRIIRWDRTGRNIVAEPCGVDDLVFARACYEIAVKRWPDDPITLQQGARIISKNRDDL